MYAHTCMHTHILHVDTYCTHTQTFMYMGLWGSLTLPPWHYLLSTSPVWDSCHILPWARLTFSLWWSQWRCTTFFSSLPLLISSSSPCQSSQCCHSGSVSELNCLWAKIQTHLRDRGRLLTQTLLTLSTSISLLFCLSTLPYVSFFPFPRFSFFFFYWSNLEYFHILDEACTCGTEYTWPGNWEVQIIPSCGKAAINWGCQPL